MSDEEILERLDTIITILSVAFEAQIDEAREKLFRDRVTAAILDILNRGEANAGELQDAVKKTTAQSVRTVQVRLAALVDQHLIQRRGSGPSTSYRAISSIAAPAKRTER